MKTESKPYIGATFGVSIATTVDLLMARGVIVTSIKVKYPGIDPLLVVSAKSTEGPKIAFINAPTLDACGVQVEKMTRNNAIPWREDKWQLERLAQNEEV